MVRNISRRNLLKVGVAGALALSAGGIWQMKKETRANNLLDEFPKEIPGARDVKKHKIIGADKTLVHVKQAHQIYPITPELKRLVSGVQTDIYSILSHLYEQNGLKQVYIEGDSPEFAKLRKQFGLENILGDFHDEKTSKLNMRLIDLEHELSPLRVHYEIPKGMTQEQYKAKCEDELKKVRKELKEYLEFNKHYNGGAKVLEIEGKIKCIPAENEQVHLLAQIMQKKYEQGQISEEERDKVLYQDREDTALDIISRSQNPLDVLVYGAGHRFGDNINKWNKQNPDRKYSLVEVTPESYGRKE